MAALSVRVSAPVPVPEAVGVKVTPMEQLAPAARFEPQLFVWLKSPLTAMPAMVSVVLPELVNITVCAALEVFRSCAENVRPVGESVTTGTPPVPIKLTI